MEYLRFEYMALADSTHEDYVLGLCSYELWVEVKGNSEEVISVVTFLTLFKSIFENVGGCVKVLTTRELRWGFLRGRIREVAVKFLVQ